MTTITISLSDSMKDFLEEQVSQEGFGNVEEYLCSLIRDEQKRQAQSRLESVLLQGIQSEASPMTQKDWSDIREEVRRRHSERATGGNIH